MYVSAVSSPLATRQRLRSEGRLASLQKARVLAAACVCAALLGAPAMAWAGEDAAVQKTVQEVMREEYPGSLGPAKT